MNCLRQVINKSSAETPYGVPYRPAIWGAGWDIQSFAFRHYFVNKAFPELTNKEVIWNALNFVLGCHPGPVIRLPLPLVWVPNRQPPLTA